MARRPGAGQMRHRHGRQNGPGGRSVETNSWFLPKNHMESLCGRDSHFAEHDQHHRNGRRRPSTIAHHDSAKDTLPALMLGAIGVVYGDIGTSPLYAMKESFIGPHPLAVDPAAHLRRADADLLVADADRHGQICVRRDARRQQGRGRIVRAAGADLAPRSKAAMDRRRWSCSACSPPRCSMATR